MNLTVGKELGIRRTRVQEAVLVRTPDISKGRGRRVELGIRRNAVIGSQLKQTLDVEEKGQFVILQLLLQLLHPCSVVRLDGEWSHLHWFLISFPYTVLKQRKELPKR